MHSLAAYKLGLKEKGEEYLRKTLFLDLCDNMDNTAGEGIHVGAMGTALQSVLMGILDIKERKPNLPSSWKSLETTLYFEGKRVKVRADKENLQILDVFE